MGYLIVRAFLLSSFEYFYNSVVLMMELGRNPSVVAELLIKGTSMHSKRKAILYIAASLDGFIAGPGDDLSFLDIAESKGEDYGYGDFISTVDTIVMGRKTYDWVMKNAPDFVHADKEVYIITHSPRPAQSAVQFYAGELKALMEDLKSKDGRNIFIDGGAEIVNQLLKDKLIDEIIIFTIPILLGEGVRLFQEGRYPTQELKLIGTMEYKKTGVVGVMYKRKEKEATDI